MNTDTANAKLNVKKNVTFRMPTSTTQVLERFAAEYGVNKIDVLCAAVRLFESMSYNPDIVKEVYQKEPSHLI